MHEFFPQIVQLSMLNHEWSEPNRQTDFQEWLVGAIELRRRKRKCVFS